MQLRQKTCPQGARQTFNCLTDSEHTTQEEDEALERTISKISCQRELPYVRLSTFWAREYVTEGVEATRMGASTTSSSSNT